MNDNDWPEEVRVKIKKLTKEEAEAYSHDVIPPQRAEEAHEDWKKQLKDDPSHPAYSLRDKN